MKRSSPGAQTERPGDAGPVSIQLGGKDSPAAFVFKASADCVRAYFFNSNSFCASSPANFQSNLAPKKSRSADKCGWLFFTNTAGLRRADSVVRVTTDCDSLRRRRSGIALSPDSMAPEGRSASVVGERPGAPAVRRKAATGPGTRYGGTASAGTAGVEVGTGPSIHGSAP